MTVKSLYYNIGTIFEKYYSDMQNLLEQGFNLKIFISQSNCDNVFACDVFCTYHMNEFGRFVLTGRYDLYTTNDIYYGLTLSSLLNRMLSLSFSYFDLKEIV